MKDSFFRHITTVMLPVLLIAVLLVFLSAVDSLDRGNIAEEKAHLEEALTKAIVSCYAIEGAYPPSLEYLTEHYGVQINQKRFVVKYELYASNLMPDITVLEK